MYHKRFFSGPGRALQTTCILYVVWTGISWNTFTLYADPVIRDLGLLRTEFMFNITLMSMANAFMSFFFGRLQAKFGLKRYMLWSGLICSACFFVLPNISSLLPMYASTFCYGLGVSALTNNSAMVITNAWLKKDVGKWIALPQTMGSISGIIFSSVNAYLISVIGWRTTMQITGCISLVAIVIIALLYIDAPTPAEESFDETDLLEDGIEMNTMVKDHRFYMLSTGYFLVGLTGYGILGNLTLIVRDLGYATAAGQVLSVALIASAVFFVPGGIICDKFGSRWMVTLCMGLLILSIFGLLIGRLSLKLIYTIGLALGIAYDASLMPTGISVQESFGNKEYGKKVSLVNAFTFTGLSFGPTAMTLFYDRFGNYDAIYHLFACMAILGAGLIFGGTKTHSKWNAKSR